MKSTFPNDGIGDLRGSASSRMPHRQSNAAVALAAPVQARFATQTMSSTVIRVLAVSVREAGCNRKRTQ